MSSESDVFSLDDLDETEQPNKDGELEARTEVIDDPEWIREQERILHKYMAFLITHEENKSKKEMEKQGTVFPELIFTETGKIAWSQETFKEFVSLNEQVHERTMNRIMSDKNDRKDYSDFLEAKENDGEFAEILKTILREQGFMDGTTIEKQIYDAITGEPRRFADGTLVKGVIPNYEAIYPSMDHLRELMKEARYRLTGGFSIPYFSETSKVKYPSFKDMGITTTPIQPDHTLTINNLLNKPEYEIYAHYLIEQAEKNGCSVPCEIDSRGMILELLFYNFARRGYKKIPFISIWRELGNTSNPNMQSVESFTRTVEQYNGIFMKRVLYVKDKKQKKSKILDDPELYEIKPSERKAMKEGFYFLPVRWKDEQSENGNPVRNFYIVDDLRFCEIAQEKDEMTGVKSMSFKNGKRLSDGKWVFDIELKVLDYLATKRSRNPKLFKDRISFKTFFNGDLTHITKKVEKTAEYLDHLIQTEEIYSYHIDCRIKERWIYVFMNRSEKSRMKRKYNIDTSSRIRKARNPKRVTKRSKKSGSK